MIRLKPFQIFSKKLGTEILKCNIFSYLYYGGEFEQLLLSFCSTLFFLHYSKNQLLPETWYTEVRFNETWGKVKSQRSEK